jgi:hypothetical protein
LNSLNFDCALFWINALKRVQRLGFQNVPDEIRAQKVTLEQRVEVTAVVHVQQAHRTELLSQVDFSAG